MSEQMSENKPQRSRRSIVMALLPLVLFAALAWAFFGQLTNNKNPSQIPSALLDKSVPEFAMPPLDGLARDGVALTGIKTADFMGKVSVVNVWASWCVPCRAEHPIIVDIGKDKRVWLVGINYKDKTKNALRFLGQRGNPYAAVGVDPKGRVAIDWGVYGIPETFIIGRDATIRYKHVGPLGKTSYEKLKVEIEAALAE